MKAKSPTLGSRHPKVVMVFEHEEDVSGAGQILSAQINEYRTIPLNNDTASYISKVKPLVILFALSNVAKCIEFYAVLVEKGKLDHPHYSILLCNNKESSVAFRCCMKGLFDNYFVYQPLYEKFRLLMIVHNGLTSCQSKTEVASFNENVFDEIDDELAQLIDESSLCKQNLLAKISQGQENLIKATEELQQQSITQSLSPQEVMTTITQEHVKPLLSMLENDISVSLDKMLNQLIAQQLALKTKSQQSEGLIKNSPPVQKKHEDFATADVSVATQENELDASNSTKPPVEVINVAPNIEVVKYSKILVVEDNALYRDMLVSVLLKEKFDVYEAPDGLSALQKIRDHQFDLIIMDLFMPKLDGLNATKKIQQISGGKPIPVVALTGNKNKELIRKWASFGLKGYIIKPSTKEEILSTVRRIIGATVST